MGLRLAELDDSAVTEVGIGYEQYFAHIMLVNLPSLSARAVSENLRPGGHVKDNLTARWAHYAKIASRSIRIHRKEIMSRRRGTDAEYLFYDYDFFSLQESQRQKMAKAIAVADAQLFRDGVVETLAKEFSDQFVLEVPQLIEGAISMNAEEAQVDVAGNYRFGAFGPGPHYVAGIKVSYYVPYSGEKAMFKCKPTTWTTVLPAAELSDEELKLTFRRPDQDVAATKNEFEAELAQINQYLGWLRENCGTFNPTLIVEAQRQVSARKARLEQMTVGTQSLGVPIRSAGAGQSRSMHPDNRVVAPRPAATPSERYDVALSFAGENRAYVESVAAGLKAAGVSVFYDGFEKANLWGKNLIDHLAEVYEKRSRFVVMFISKEYVEKAWTTHERRHAQARALVAQGDYILPARFDDTEVPGMTNTVGFQDLRLLEPRELVTLILQKLHK